MTKPDLFEQWRDLRSQLQHEDGLVNQRLLWMLAFSGFLFAAYGYSLTAEATLVAGIDQVDTEAVEHARNSIVTMRLALSFAGIGVGMAALLGAGAAFYAIIAAAAVFPSHRLFGFYGNPIGSDYAPFLGIIGGIAFPSLTVGIWLFLALRLSAFEYASAAAIGGFVAMALGIITFWCVIGPIANEKRRQRKMSSRRDDDRNADV